MSEKKTVKLHSKKNGVIALYQVWKTNDDKFILTVDPMGDSWSNAYAYWSDESGSEYDPGDPIALSGHRGFVGCLKSLGYTILHDR